MEFQGRISQILDGNEGLLQEYENFMDESESENRIEDHDPNLPPKRKHYQRHTRQQIQRLEEVFNQRPHPDERQRKVLSAELGLEPLKIKFWFQNRRTQTKNKQERQVNKKLKTENAKLRAENEAYKEALSSATCPNCGGPSSLGEMSLDEHLLRAENAQLREEIYKMSEIAKKCRGKSIVSHSPPSHTIPSFGQSELGVTIFDAQPHMGGEMFGGGEMMSSVNSMAAEMEKQTVIELANAALEELLEMSQLGEPLWLSAGPDNSIEILNEEEYFRTFSRRIGPKPFGLKTEATRESGVVFMSASSLVEILMDVNKWSAFFSGIVSRAMTMEVLSTGGGNYNKALQVMLAKYQLPSPLVPVRESLFLRYCKKQQSRTWIVVDVSLDTLCPSPIKRCQRRPSGCLIQEMQGGLLKVTWVEHVEVDDMSIHDMYKPIVNSGVAFGAKRWLATLVRQCERLTSVMAFNIPNGYDNTTAPPVGTENVLKLAERMVISFCAGVSGLVNHDWVSLSGTGADDVRIMSRKTFDDPGRPLGVVLNASISFRLPVLPKTIYDFLRDETSRTKWDILTDGGIVQEMAQIAIGKDHDNCILLLHVNGVKSDVNVNKEIMIIQESCFDATSAYLIYAPVNISAISKLLSGWDPDKVQLLPSGFSIVPNEPSRSNGGSLLTISFQILVDSNPQSTPSIQSVETVNNLVMCTRDKIKKAVLGNNVDQ